MDIGQNIDIVSGPNNLLERAVVSACGPERQGWSHRVPASVAREADDVQDLLAAAPWTLQAAH